MPLPPPSSFEPSNGPRMPQPPSRPLTPPAGPPAAPPPAPAGATCYRHPSRAAGRRCTRCGKPACAECLVQATVGSHCVDCAKASRPDLATRARYWTAGKAALVTYTVIAVNVAFFAVLALWHDPVAMLRGSLTEGHVDFGLNTAFLQGDTLFSGGREVTNGDEWYRLITSGFLHFGLLHLALNMYFLFLLGNEIEPLLGRARFALLYLAGLLGGAAGSLLIDDVGYVAAGDQLLAIGAISGGASGAVFGLLGAYATGIWQHGVNPLSTSIGSLLLINLFITFMVPRISIGGHIGGLVAGAVCGFVMLAPNYKGFPAWSRVVTPVAMSAISVTVAVLVAR